MRIIRDKRGTSLVEGLCYVAIISLIYLSYPVVESKAFLSQASDEALEQGALTIDLALNRYYLLNGIYPPDINTLKTQNILLNTFNQTPYTYLRHPDMVHYRLTYATSAGSRMSRGSNY